MARGGRKELFIKRGKNYANVKRGRKSTSSRHREKKEKNFLLI